MRSRGILEAVMVALFLALAGGAAYTVLGLLVGPAGLLELVVTGLAGAYVAYLLSRSRERSGRVAVFVIWILCACAGLLFTPNFAELLAGHAVGIWLLRAFYFHERALSALADLGVSMVAVAGGLWAASRSGSVFMAMWCFFLVQALCTSIPDWFSGRVHRAPLEPDRFQRAYRSAETVLRKISSERESIGG